MFDSTWLKFDLNPLLFPFSINLRERAAIERIGQLARRVEGRINFLEVESNHEGIVGIPILKGTESCFWVLGFNSNIRSCRYCLTLEHCD